MMTQRALGLQSTIAPRGFTSVSPELCLGRLPGGDLAHQQLFNR
jgi:hypothetical protein